MMYEKKRPDLNNVFIMQENKAAKNRAAARSASQKEKELSKSELISKLRISKSKTIKILKDQLDIAGTEFADICDVDRSAIRSLEDGRVDTMTYKILRKIADILNCSVDKLADANKNSSMKESKPKTMDYVGMKRSSEHPDAEVHGRSLGSKNKKISLDMTPADNRKSYQNDEGKESARAIKKMLKSCKTNNVYKARTELDIPRTVLADICGVNFQMIRVIERKGGAENMRYGILRKIADAFDCSVDDLVKDN